MTDILARIDATTAGLCPCGAQPTPGSAYCGYDCEPTHISRDTDTRTAGQLATPMRWRPDLVIAEPDDGLTLLDEERRGRFNARTYERAGGQLHLRLDDGHRYVGTDVAEDMPHEPVWERLERELRNPRHVTTSDPWADVMPPDGIVRVVSLNAATVILRYSDGSEQEIALHDGGDLAVTTETHHDVEDISIFPQTLTVPRSNRYRIVLDATYHPGSTTDGTNLTVTSRPATEPSNPQRGDSAPSTY